MREPVRAPAIFLVLATISLVITAASGMAQTAPPVARFTFVPANFPGAPPMNIVIKRWSSEADRDRVMTAAASGLQELGYPIASSFEVGYIDWPGALQYLVRYA